MSFIDWGIAQDANQNLRQLPQQARESALAGYQLGQTGAVYSALRGVNLSDPASVQNALNGLASVNAADQAKALTDLAYTRGLNQAKLPLIQSVLGRAQNAVEAQGSPPAPDQATSPAEQSAFPGAPSATPDQLQQAQQTMQAATQAIARVRSLPADQRSAALDQEAQQFQTAGMDPRAIAVVKGHLADNNFSNESLDDLTDHYSEHAANFGTMAAGGAPAPNLSTHATNDWASQPSELPASQALMSDPVYRNAQGVATGLYADPNVQLGLTAAGLQVPEAVNQAIGITGVARNQEATAPYQPVELKGSQNQPVQMSAANFAAGQSRPNAQPIIGATPGQVAAQTAAATAPYTPVTIPGPQGQQQVESAEQFAAGRGAPTAPGQVNGPANAAPISGPTPAAGIVNQAGGTQYASDLVTAGQSQQQVNALQQIIRLLPITNTGPGAEATNGWRSFLQTQLPILNKIIPGTDQRAIDTANTGQLQKYMVQLASAASGQYGPATNDKLAAAVSGNPHMSMDNLSALDVSKTMLALKRADMAKPYLFSTTGQDPSQYAGFSSNYARTVDPRAFELDMLTPSERQAMLATITTPEEKDRFTRGVQAAEAAGYYHRADLPR